MTLVKVPPVSISMQQVKVVRWLVADGVSVRRGTSLVEVETDKALVEIESPSDGVLHIKVSEGSLVDLDADAVLAEILAQGESSRCATTPAREKPRIRVAGVTRVAKTQPPVGSPAARRLAREHGIDLTEVRRGSGPDGRIVSADVEHLIAVRGE